MKFIPGKKNRVKDTVCDSCFHPDGEIYALGTLTSRVELYKSSAKIQEICNHHNESSIRKIRFNSNGKLLSAARIVRIYDLESKVTEKLKLTNSNPELGKDKIYSLATFGPNMVCAGTDSGSFQLWDSRKGRQPIHVDNGNHGYISDIHGSIKKHLYITSGDGYITGYDMRKLRCLNNEPTLFDTGFNCVRLSQDKKLIVGTESGSLYIFNKNNFDDIVMKMALADDSGNRGEKGINALETLADEQTFVAGCTDGKLRSFSFVGNQYEPLDILPVAREEIESVHINPKYESQLLCSGPTFVQLIDYEDEESGDNDKDDSDSDDEDSESDDDEPENIGSKDTRSNDAKGGQREQKNIITEHTEDYLNLF